MDALRPVVAASIFIFKDGKLLLGKRKSADASNGMYGVPGGKLDLQETFAECVQRELAEEVGGQIGNVRMVCVANSRQFAPAHYVIAIFACDWMGGEPENREPHKCEGWEWFPLDAIPQPTTYITNWGIEALRDGARLKE